MRGLEGLRARVAAWPALTRDAGAAALVLGSVAFAQGLILVLGVPVEVMLAAPGILLALMVFGGTSTVFAALLAGAAIVAALDPAARALVWNLPAISAVALALGCLATAFGIAGLGACAVMRARAAVRERRTRALIAACAQDALSQIEAAHARLASAEAEIAEARRQLALANAAARRGLGGRDPIEDALRSEGGV